MRPWRTIKVIVEVAVQDHEHRTFTAKDLCWSVKRAMDSDGFWQDKKYLPKESQPRFGQVHVKQFNKVMAKQPNAESPLHPPRNVV